MKKQHLKKRFLSKRVLIISGASLLVAAILVYTWFSAQAWNTASTSTAKASSVLKSSVDTKLATQATPVSTQAALDEILKDYNGALTQGPCELPALYEWQSNLPWLKDQRQKCLNTSKSSEELATALKNMQTYLKDISSSAALLKQATDSTTSTTDYTAAAATWQKVADDKSLVTEGAFKPIGVKISEVSKAIADAYTALVAANTKQDKAAFNTAEQALKDAYTRLDEIKSAANTAQAALVTTIINAYSKV
jgi:hypothetical protein